jgi:APA family basic amino acid/polyamine antiporter
VSEPPQLVRAIRLPHATAMVVGTIVGASIFVQASQVSKEVPTVLGIFGVWIAAGIITLFGALVCAELASTFTKTGGVYRYLREAFTPAAGFLWGWAMFWVMHSGIIAIVAMITARYVGHFVDLGDEGAAGTKAVAIGVIFLWSAINYIGVRHGSFLQTAFTLGKLLAIAAILILGFVLGSTMDQRPEQVSGEVAMTGFLTAVAAGLFAYGGWHMVTYNSEETVDPGRTIPRALMIGVAVVTVCYVAMNAVYLYVLPLDQVISSERVAADAADALVQGGGDFVSALVIFSAFGGISGIILSGPRVYYAMARDGLLFRWAGKIHPTFKTPHRAILLQALWSSVLVATGTYRALFTRVVYTEWIFFGAMAIGLFLFRRRADLRRGYSVWGYPWVPLVFIVCAFAIAVHAMVTNAEDAAWGMGLVLLGLPVYYLWTWGRRKFEGTGGAAE